MVHELLVLELLLMLLEQPTDSSIEVAVALAKDTGAFLQDVAPVPANQCTPPPSLGPHTSLQACAQSAAPAASRGLMCVSKCMRCPAQDRWRGTVLLKGISGVTRSCRGRSRAGLVRSFRGRCAPSPAAPG